MSWKTAALGEVITLKRGYDLPHDMRADGDVPVVMSKAKSRVVASGYASDANSGVVMDSGATMNMVNMLKDIQV